MSEATDRILDLRADGRLILCACELKEKIDNFLNQRIGPMVVSVPIDAWEPGEDVDRDAQAREIIETAMNIVEQIETVNREGRG